MKSITITAEDDLSSMKVAITGDWNGGHTRRALCLASKEVRHRATIKHYAYVEDELKAERDKAAAAVEEQAQLDKENEEANEKYRKEEAIPSEDESQEADEDLPEKDDEAEKDSNDLSYLS